MSEQFPDIFSPGAEPFSVLERERKGAGTEATVVAGGTIGKVYVPDDIMATINRLLNEPEGESHE